MRLSFNYIFKITMLLLFISFFFLEEDIKVNVFTKNEGLDTVIKEELQVSNNITSDIEFLDYEVEYKTSFKVPLYSEEVVIEGKKGILEHYYKNVEGEQFYLSSRVVSKPINEVIAVGKGNPGMFIGNITGYGPDCKGCTGYTACYPHPDVRNGNIYFSDKEYGTIRIIAADKGVPCGTIMKISNYKFSKKPVIAVVLDRGGSIVGKTTDLLHNAERETAIIGRQHNIRYDILRWGW